MKIREKFREYWIAGFLFIVVSSLTSGLLSFVSSLFSTLPLQTIYKSDSVEVTIPLQPAWLVVIILFAGAVIIIVPWAYGRIIEVLHNEFILEKKT